MKKYKKNEEIEREKIGRETRGSLGELEAGVLSKLAKDGRTIFTTADLKPLCKNPPKMAHDLARKNWILKLRKGLYTIAELSYGERGAKVVAPHEFIIASAMAKPYYISFWSALNYHGLSDQVPQSVFVAVTRFRKNLTILNTRFEFITLPEYRFFGMEKEMIGGKAVLFSGKEKTIADCLDRPDLCGGIEEIARAINFNHEDLDFTGLKECLLKNRNSAAVKRLLFILDFLGIATDVFKDIPLSKSYSPLDPTEPRKGKHSKEFGLLINKKLNPEGWVF